MNKELWNKMKNWRVLNEHLTTLTEDELKEMLTYELEHENRKTVVERLHQRWNVVRSTRERNTLMERFTKEN